MSLDFYTTIFISLSCLVKFLHNSSLKPIGSRELLLPQYHFSRLIAVQLVIKYYAKGFSNIVSGYILKSCFQTYFSDVEYDFCLTIKCNLAKRSCLEHVWHTHSSKLCKVQRSFLKMRVQYRKKTWILCEMINTYLQFKGICHLHCQQSNLWMDGATNSNQYNKQK